MRTQQTARRDLTQETERANRRLAAEQAALARQVRSSYMTGREELFKLLLSQESPAGLGRMLVYFDYYNRARSARIGAVAGELAKLADARNRRRRVEAELAALEAAQAREVAALERSRDERRAAVAKLDAEIRDGTAAVAKLRAEEQRLAELVHARDRAHGRLPRRHRRAVRELEGQARVARARRASPATTVSRAARDP